MTVWAVQWQDTYEPWGWEILALFHAKEQALAWAERQWPGSLNNLSQDAIHEIDGASYGVVRIVERLVYLEAEVAPDLDSPLL